MKNFNREKRYHTILKLLLAPFAAMLIAFAAQPTQIYSQIVDTVDIMKEFDEYSFRDAQPVGAIKDSTKLREHLLGVKWGFSMNNAFFSVDYSRLPTYSPKNFGLYYTYYHSLWNSIPLFGIQTGVEYNSLGFEKVYYLADDKTIDERGKQSFTAITVPLVSQFRVDFWKMRLLANVGAYGHYINSATFTPGIEPDTLTASYKKFGYGLVGGGGLAFVFRPFEVQFEVNFKYTLSNMYDKEKFYRGIWVSSHASQLTFSAGLFYRIGGYSYKIPSNAPNYKPDMGKIKETVIQADKKREEIERKEEIEEKESSQQEDAKEL